MNLISEGLGWICEQICLHAYFDVVFQIGRVLVGHVNVHFYVELVTWVLVLVPFEELDVFLEFPADGFVYVNVLQSSVHDDETFDVDGPVVQVSYVSLDKFLESFVHCYQLFLVAIQALKDV